MSFSRLSQLSSSLSFGAYQTLYGLAILTSGFVLPVLEKRSKRVGEGFTDYLGYLPLPPDDRPLIWVHGVSLGESLVASGIMQALRTSYPHLALGFTTTHPDVLATIKKRDLATVSGYYPLDFLPIIQRTFNRWAPRAILITETDFWPGLAWMCARKSIPLILLNGRISGKLEQFYTLFRSVGTRLFSAFALLGVQTQLDAQRLERMGAPRSKIRVLGNVKVDLPAGKNGDIPEKIQLWLGTDELLIFGSMHPTEFEAFLSSFPRLLGGSGRKLLIAPRNLANVEPWMQRLETAGISVGRRSQLGSCHPIEASKILLLDTMGELASLYKLGSAVFVGGSLDPFVGGHNPIEAMQQGIPVLMGPHTRNFADLVEDLTTNQGLRIVQSSEDLCEAVQCWRNHPETVHEQVEKGYSVLRKHQGALHRSIEMLSELLPKA